MSFQPLTLGSITEATEFSWGRLMPGQYCPLCGHKMYWVRITEEVSCVWLMGGCGGKPKPQPVVPAAELMAKINARRLNNPLNRGSETLPCGA